MSPEEQKAYNAGVQGGSYYNAGKTLQESLDNQRAYERGKSATQNSLNAPHAIEGFLTFIRPLLKFAVLYSSFILLAWCVVSGLNVVFPVNNTIKFIIGLFISYLFICFFQYLRGRVLAMRKKEATGWKLFYYLLLVFVVMTPALLGFFFVVSSLESMFRTGFLTSIITLAIVFLILSYITIKSYGYHDLLNENNAHFFDKWALDAGLNKH